jgi:hypothetical protein
MFIQNYKLICEKNKVAILFLFHPFIHPLKIEKALIVLTIKALHFYFVPQTGIEPVLALLQTGF